MLLSAASSGVSIVFDGNVDVVVSVDAVAGAGAIVDADAVDLRGILYT
jgi:hypothetical protein